MAEQMLMFCTLPGAAWLGLGCGGWIAPILTCGHFMGCSVADPFLSFLQGMSGLKVLPEVMFLLDCVS